MGPEFLVHRVLILRKVERRIELLNEVALHLLRVIIRQDVEYQVILHPSTKFTLIIGVKTHVSIVWFALIPGNKRVAK